MNLFRSEEHIGRWLTAQGLDDGLGATVSVGTLAGLADAWWGDRLSPDWQPHSREHNQAILDRVGLVGEFWRLP